MAHDHPDHHHEHAQATPQSLQRGEGVGKVLFVDAFSGVAGDMLLAALIDLGVPLEMIEEALGGLELSGYALKVSPRTRSGIVARQLEVNLTEEQPSRDHHAIKHMLREATTLTEGARRLALESFARLAEAEARVHGTTADQVHFHEVGAVDSIVDIVGCCVALEYIGATVVSSPLPMGRGTIKSQHGVIPGPAPATVGCLSGVPTYDAGIDAELVTPTGACLIATAARQFARWPAMRPSSIGWGSGQRDLSDRPNLLRVVLGDPNAPDLAQSTHVVIEANIDDMSGELVAAAVARVQEAGALDVWTTPIGMKKGRPALTISALATRPQLQAVSNAMLAETSTLGVRIAPSDRIERPREVVEVETRYGAIAVKVARGDGLPSNVAPEYDSCEQAARRHGVPVKQVYAAAIASYQATGA